MDLYVRSQDRKRLIPNPNFYIFWSEENNIAYIGDITVGHIAKYKTEERALEVLDEITNVILGIICLEDIEEQGIKNYTGNAILSKKSNNIVYEMPKE